VAHFIVRPKHSGTRLHRARGRLGLRSIDVATARAQVLRFDPCYLDRAPKPLATEIDGIAPCPPLNEPIAKS
jgi:hypothetical protein